MQPIAVDKEVFREIFSRIDVGKSSETLNLITRALHEFHHIVVTKTQAEISDWQAYMNKLKESFNSPIVSYFVDALLSPAHLRFIEKQIGNSENTFIEQALQTPDKIGLSNKIKSKEIKVYNVKNFIADEFHPNNNLFRLNKNVNVKPDYRFANLNFLYPYLREAKKLEIIDKQLFKDSRKDTEVNLLLEIVKLAKNIQQLQLHWEPSKINIRHKEFIKKVKEFYPKIEILSDTQYKTRSKNHDRFLIINHDQISIRFTCSFNNFYFENGVFNSKAAFRISYEKGRQFFD